MIKLKNLINLSSKLTKGSELSQVRYLGTTDKNDSKSCGKGGKKSKKWPLLITFGNPIYDMTFKLKDDSIFKKFNLVPNSQYLKPTKEINQIREHALKLTNGKMHESAGGSSLNTAKILGTLLKGKQTVLFCGAVGRDKHGENMRNMVKDVELELVDIPKVQTGTCLCLIWKENACLIADIGASQNYILEHMCTKKMQKYYDKSHFIYVEGFFLPGRFKEVKYLLDDVCAKQDNVFIWNLSAAYISTTFPKESKFITSKSDFVVGNVEQFMDLGKVYKTKNLKEIMERTFEGHDCVKKRCKHFQSKLAVATDGSKPIHMMYNTKKDFLCYEVYQPPLIQEKDIKDTTGAGDSFLAGFLRGYLANKSPLRCAVFGSKVSADIIDQYGVTLSRGFTRHTPKV